MSAPFPTHSAGPGGSEAMPAEEPAELNQIHQPQIRAHVP